MVLLKSKAKTLNSVKFCVNKFLDLNHLISVNDVSKFGCYSGVKDNNVESK